jgi:AraC family transcriptional regulator
MNSAEAFQSQIEWPGMRSEYAWLPPHEGFTETKPNQIGVSFSLHRSALFSSAGREREMHIPPGSVFVTGREPIVWTQVHEITEALEIYPDTAVLHAVAATGGHSRFEIEPASTVRDAVVLSIASILKRAHVASTHISDVAASTLAQRLSHHLLTTYCGLKLPALAYRGILSRPRVARINAYVQAHLTDAITLEQLAALVDLSPFHFARAFKRTTGLAPHQFVTLARIEHAKVALLHTDETVQSIAYSVGYTNISHFRRVFRAHTGRLPSELRAV